MWGGVSRGDDHQHVSWRKNGKGEEKESRASMYVSLEVGEIGWSVWAAGAWCPGLVGKESSSQEPASTKFLCNRFFLELFPEIEM